ncbi:MAG: tail fiber domain-containing protein [Chitinophagales bacterium]|nr:tail fiber domain-containing protein [Chitinophagales bacterium]
MKTQYLRRSLLLFFFVICQSYLWAQVKWDLLGNNLTGNSILGSTSSGYRIDFYNDNTPAMSLTTSTLRFGIGLTAPQNKLHIDGGAADTYCQITNSYTGSSSGTTGLQLGVNTNGDAIIKSNFSSNQYGDMRLYTGGTERMTILGRTGLTDVGWVGINNPTPLAVLHVDGKYYGTGDMLRTVGDYNYASSWSLRAWNSIYSTQVEYGKIFNAGSGANDFIMQSSVGGGSLWFNTTPNGGSPITRMVISSTGKVGIGTGTTTAPSKQLEVADNSGDQLRLTYSGSTTKTDFQTNASGYLNIQPSGNRIGINLSPTATIDIFPNGSGDDPLRLRNLNTGSQTDFLVVDANAVVKKRAITNMVTTCATSGQYYIPVFCATSSTIQNGQIYDNGSKVSIGTTSATGRFQTNESSNYGIAIRGVTTGTYTHAIEALASGTNSAGVSSVGYSYGVSGKANGVYDVGGSPMIGVWGNADGTNNTGTGNSGNAGVYGDVIYSKATADNYGVYGSATADGSAAGTVTNYGVYGNASGGDVNWAVYANGNAGGTTIWNPSDAMLKKDIADIPDATSKINKLIPHTYYFDTVTYSFVNLPSSLQYGFISEEVEPICPNLVKQFTYPQVSDTSGNVIHDAFDVKYMNYTGYIPLIVKVLQEQEATIDALQAQLDACCSSGMRLQDQGSNPTQTIKIVAESIAQLGDCKPNPTDGNTIIIVRVPEKISEALIILTDQLGKEVFREAITNRGYSNLNIETSQLENGIYHYSLIADGQLIDTKQLIKQH